MMDIKARAGALTPALFVDSVPKVCQTLKREFSLPFYRNKSPPATEPLNQNCPRNPNLGATPPNVWTFCDSPTAPASHTSLAPLSPPLSR